VLSIFISFSLHFLSLLLSILHPPVEKEIRILHATLHLSLSPFSGVLCVLLIYNDLIYYLNNVCVCAIPLKLISSSLFSFIYRLSNDTFLDWITLTPPPQTHLKIFFLSSFLFGWFLRHKWFVLWHLFFRFFFFLFSIILRWLLFLTILYYITKLFQYFTCTIYMSTCLCLIDVLPRPPRLTFWETKVKKEGMQNKERFLGEIWFSN
jgi:hypothetical protein